MNRRKSFQTAAALDLSLSLALASRAEDWPQWRGPNRDGVWNETGVMESFPTGGLRISWRRPVGPGFSSPVVAQGRVYVTDSQVSGPKARERVLCFDAKTGNRLWTHAYEVDYADWAFDPKNITLNGKSALLFNDKGELIRADLDMTGYKEISRAALLQPTSPYGPRKMAWTPPAYADRQVFARSDEELVCASLAAKPLE